VTGGEKEEAQKGKIFIWEIKGGQKESATTEDEGQKRLLAVQKEKKISLSFARLRRSRKQKRAGKKREGQKEKNLGKKKKKQAPYCKERWEGSIFEVLWGGMNPAIQRKRGSCAG